MRHGHLVLLALLLLLAGCSTSTSDGATGGLGSVTPVPVTDAESVDRVTVRTTTEAEWLPSMDGGAFAGLLDDHEAALSNTSYNYTMTVTSRGEARVIPNRTISGYWDADATVYYFEDRSERFADDRRWSNGSVGITGVDGQNGASYEVTERPRPYVGPFQGPNHLRRTLEFAEPTGVSENDTHYRIEAVLVERNGRSLFSWATVENSSISITVTTDGVIESYRFEMRGHTASGERVHLRREFTLDRSADTLPRPEWVETALASEREQ